MRSLSAAEILLALILNEVRDLRAELAAPRRRAAAVRASELEAVADQLHDAADHVGFLAARAPEP